MKVYRTAFGTNSRHRKEKAMKKITSVLLALLLVLSLFAFTACEKEPRDLLEDAAKLLGEKPYTMTMKMDFSSDNAEMNSVFEMMNLEIPVHIDGDNLAMDMSMEIMEQTITTKMSIVDKVLYYDIQAAGLTQKLKANLSDEQLKEFWNDQSLEMPVDYSQFAEFKSEKKGDKTVISCTGITDEGKKALNDEMASALEGLGGSAEMDDLSYTITIDDGKYESMALSCTYTVEVAGQSTTVTMNMRADISYDNVPAITVPADADSYTSVNFDDIMNGSV